ncbi:MAG: hypothetical protein IT280_04765 [Ignavibacteria bacterium]|nr:hypothetical protein [Ignavibacteria bacterium]
MKRIVEDEINLIKSEIDELNYKLSIEIDDKDKINIENKILELSNKSKQIFEHVKENINSYEDLENHKGKIDILFSKIFDRLTFLEKPSRSNLTEEEWLKHVEKVGRYIIQILILISLLIKYL